MRIDPWSSQQSTDYQRLRDEFGIEDFAYGDRLPGAHRLVRRGIIFGHRGFDSVLHAIERGEPWAVLTGLMPSGPMHLGHKMVLDQVMYYQSLGADIIITVADIEAYSTRGLSLERCRELAMSEYIENYFALGLKPENTQIYFQSEREDVKDLAWKLGRHVNWSAMEAIYGFGSETNLGHVMSPLVQVGDILHVQLPKYGGPRPVVVPVGVDQDPHIRLTRDLAAASREYSVQWTKDQKLGDVLGVFVKGAVPDDRVDAYLKDAEEAILALGFADLVVNAPYRALYLRAAVKRDQRIVDAALAQVEVKHGAFGFLPPAATYHRFQSGLTGGKMSSSKPETHIALREDPVVAQKKLSSAKTGGRATAAEQRELGANPYICTVYESFVYHLVDSDDELKVVHDECVSGARLCGDCKGLAKVRIAGLLDDLRKHREGDARRIAEDVVSRAREIAAAPAPTSASQARGTAPDTSREDSP